MIYDSIQLTNAIAKAKNDKLVFKANMPVCHKCKQRKPKKGSTYFRNKFGKPIYTCKDCQ